MDRLKYIVWILLSVCLISSCSEEEILNHEKEVSSNEPFRTLTINYNAPTANDITISRAASEIPQDFYVTDLYIYVFDYVSSSLLSVDADNKTAPSHLSGEELDNGISGKQELKGDENNKYNSSWARIKVKSEAFGNEVRIYMIANASSYSDILTHDELMSITEEKDLKDMICTYKNAASAPNRTNILMSGNGSKNGTPDAARLYIDQSGRILGSVGGMDASILLERTEAKINFNFKSGSNCTFTPTGYKIYNYPKLSYMLWKYTLQDGVANYENIRGKDASQKKEDFFEGPIEIETKGNFTFYMPENLKYPEFADHGGIETTRYQSSLDGYKFRETREGDGWKNAPKLATYVEVNGVFKGYSEKLEKNVTANVTYTVHLGFAKQEQGTSNNDVNDYFTKRNHEYTYNITVNGIDDIITEVITNNEKTPAEGIITLEPETVEITTRKGSQKLPLHPKETLEKESPEDDCSWFTLNIDTEIETWIEKKDWWNKKQAQYFNFKAKSQLAEGESREVVLIAKRESADKRSIIKRRIIFKQVSE